MVVAISPNGRFVLFDSWASNLVPGDSNGVNDVFLRDRRLGRTTRVSVGPGGRQANGPSRGVAVSSDGRFVLFVSKATNVTNQPDRNDNTDVFVRNRLRSRTFRVSVAPGGGQFIAGPNESGISAAGISDNGRWVAMGDIGPSTSRCTFIDERTYIRDRVGRATRQVRGCGNPVALSPNGQWLVLSGARSPLRLRNLATGHERAFSPPFSGFGGLTPDGHYAAYGKWDGSIGQNGQTAAWRWNRITDRTRLVHRCGVGPNGFPYSCDPVSISADGSHIAFLSNDPTLVSGDTNAANDLFSIDIKTGTIARLDLSSSGTQIAKGVAEGGTGMIAPGHAALLSSNGRWAAFTARNGSVVPSDTNHALDVFLRGPLS